MDELYIDNLSGLEFEDYLFNLFENLGYEVESTPASNDYGADLIVSKNTERIVVQAKRYSNTVGISAIQEVIGAKNYYQANKCMVVTNNYFTPNAIELAKVNGVELWDREILIKNAILSVNPRFNVESKEIVLDYEGNTLYKIDDTDELLQAAIYLVVSEKMASISMLQRRLRIGYARAARLIDEMELRGIIGGYEGSKPRKILITEEFLGTEYKHEYEHKYNDIQKFYKKRKFLKIIASIIILTIIAKFTILKIKNPAIGFPLLLLITSISFKLGSWLTNKILRNKSIY